jgi:hypothetical protein
MHIKGKKLGTEYIHIHRVLCNIYVMYSWWRTLTNLSRDLKPGLRYSKFKWRLLVEALCCRFIAPFYNESHGGGAPIIYLS